MNILPRLTLLPLLASLALCQAPPALVVQGLGGTSATLSLADLARLPRHTVTTTAHGAPVTFQGVLLADVLAKVALPLGEKFHHTVASYYLAVEAQDGYQAVFAWAELDPTFMDHAVYLVTSRDGQPLSDKDGPFQLVVPGEKRAARWVRQVTLLRVQPLPSQTAYDSGVSRWITAHLPELESIQAGMTREQLLKVFSEEGGISQCQHRRYVYRRCPFVKVDVDFAPAGDPGGPESPSDRITKISRPFLERMIAD